MATNINYRGIPKPWQFRPWITKGHVRHFFNQILLMDHFRYLYMKLRFVYFVYLRKKLISLDLDTGDIAKETVRHNRKGLIDVLVTRSNALVKPLSAIEDLDIDSKDFVLDRGLKVNYSTWQLIISCFPISEALT